MKRATLILTLSALLPLLGSPVEAGGEQGLLCSNGFDDDGDGLVDCDDRDCKQECQGGDGGGGGFLFTCDSFRDWSVADGDPFTDRVTSDGEGSYCDTERHVDAFIGVDNGGHKLDTERSGRLLRIDFSDCATAPLEPCGALLEAFDGDAEAILSIESSADAGIHLIDDMDVGDETTVGLVIGFDNGKKNHIRLSFGRDTAAVACKDPGFHGHEVHVTRESLTTWKFVSLDSEQACLSEVRNNDWNNPVPLGYFRMPFELTVAIQP